MGIARFRNAAAGTSGYVAATTEHRCIVFVEPRLDVVGNPLLFPLVYVRCKLAHLRRRFSDR
jgi:hypothetical protein